MAKFIFSIGTINKKMLYPLSCAIVFALIQIYYYIRKDNDSIVPWYLEGFGNSTGQIMSFFYGKIFNYNRISNKKDKRHIKHYFIDVTVIFLINTTIRFVGFMAYDMFKLKDEYDPQGDRSTNLYLNDAIDIVLLTLITHFLLKYKYYIHHYISIFFLVILCSIVDFIHHEFDHFGVIPMIIAVSHIIAKVLYFSYFKYLMEFKYYFSLNVLSISGVCYFIINIVSILIFYFLHKGNGSNEITYIFYNYHRRFKTWNMVEHYLLGLIAYGLVEYPLETIIIDKLTPNYAIIVYQIAKLPQSLLKVKEDGSEYGWLIVVVLIFQIIFLLFYLEIFECNFCNLNKNTKRNIEKRSGIEQDNMNYSKNDTQSSISVKGGYDITEEVKKQECELHKVNSVNSCDDKSEINN